MKLESLRDVNKHDVLGALGLAVRPSESEKWTTGIMWLGAGLMAGAALALVFAPKSGRDMRDDLGSRLRSARDRASESVERVRDQARRALQGDVSRDDV